MIINVLVALQCTFAVGQSSTRFRAGSVPETPQQYPGCKTQEYETESCTESGNNDLWSVAKKECCCSNFGLGCTRECTVQVSTLCSDAEEGNVNYSYAFEKGSLFDLTQVV